MFAGPDAEIDADAIFVVFGVAAKPDGVAADRIFNNRREITGSVEQGDHKADGTAEVGAVEDGGRYYPAVDAGDGDFLNAEAVVELVGEAGGEVLFFGRFQVTLYLYIGGEDEGAAERVFARDCAGEERYRDR